MTAATEKVTYTKVIGFEIPSARQETSSSGHKVYDAVEKILKAAALYPEAYTRITDEQAEELLSKEGNGSFLLRRKVVFLEKGITTTHIVLSYKVGKIDHIDGNKHDGILSPEIILPHNVLQALEKAYAISNGATYIKL